MLIENEIIQQILHYEKMLQNPKNFSTEDLSQLIDDNFIYYYPEFVVVVIFLVLITLGFSYE